MERDTCPNDPGMDSVHNYMDYSRDVCSFAFTPDQRFRMEAITQVVRTLLEERPIMDLTVESIDGTAGIQNINMVAPPVDLFPFGAQYYRLQLDDPSHVMCSTDSGSSLRMRKSARPDMSFDLYDCTTETSDSTGQCDIYYAKDEVFAVVRAGGRGTEGFELRCVVIPFGNNVVAMTLGMPQQVTVQPQEMVVVRLENLPQESFVSCDVDPPGTSDMLIEFDNMSDISEQVTPREQCNTNGTRCTQDILPGQTAMNVVLSPVDSRNGAMDLILTCSATMKQPIIELEDGVASSVVDLAVHGLQLYEMHVGRNGTEVQCVASSTSGNGNLFLNWGTRPKNPNVVECRTESLEVPCKAPYFGVAGIYYPVPKLFVGVEASSAIENLVVDCSKIEKSIEPIENATLVGPLSLQERTDRVFELQVSRGALIDCRSNALAASDGEIDMYLQLNTPFDVTYKSQANCSAETSVSQETCSLKIPDDSDSSKLYITLLPFGGDVMEATLYCIVSGVASSFQEVTTEPTSSQATHAPAKSIPIVPMSTPVAIPDESVRSTPVGASTDTSATVRFTVSPIACFIGLILVMFDY